MQINAKLQKVNSKNDCEKIYKRNLDRKDAKTVPIIALSANIFEEDVIKSKEAGMDAHLAKPVNLDVLYGTLCRIY